MLELFVVARGPQEISFRRAASLSAFWIALALLFGVTVFAFADPERDGEYLAVYVIEKSLSVDNVFVFALIFSYFALPARYHYRVLFWGVVGALILRAVFVVVGAEQLMSYDWMIYVFGAFLVYTGVRMALHRDAEVHPERNVVLHLARRLVPMRRGFEGEGFFVRKAGRLHATPLFAVIVVVMTTDVVFAVDSIPAIFAITSSAFVVWTANAFAVLGLRPLYFMLAGMIQRFVYLQTGLSVVLVFVGVKFVVSDLVGKVPIWVSLPFIATVVGVSILASLWKTREQEREGAPGAEEGV